MTDLDSRKDELEKKYGIDFDSLENEQVKLARDIIVKDEFDMDLVERYGAVESVFLGNRILSCVIVCDKDFEIVDQTYVIDKVRFPYFPGFRSYRELPSMIASFEKLREKPDVVFVSGQGVIHPRLGLASHFGLASGIPTIGVSGSIIDCEAGENDGDDILKNGERVGMVLIGKEGSKPLYVSPGHNISVDSTYKISRGLINLPHKRPEPIHLASKYAKEVGKELKVEN
jgi:deoxyribonuclease V|tara:strand:+ start:951 stop:1637 length:687 start_codon:yes stop_codon:yes gene_type:complete